MMTNRTSTLRRQNGAALIIGLLLLLVLTVFAVTAMSTSTLELTLAGNNQFSEDAFQAAESAIEAEFLQGESAPGLPRSNDYTFNGVSTASTTTAYQVTRLAPPGYSLTEYQSDHYLITSVGSSGKNASSTNQQGFFVVIPSPGSP